MNGEQIPLNILLVDDDPTVLRQLTELLPQDLDGHQILWEPCGNFDEALKILRIRRFDMLVSDIYRDRDGDKDKSIAAGNAMAIGLVDEIRQRRFCPIVLFTDGQVPPDLVVRPFVWCADKSNPKFPLTLEQPIREALATGLPAIVRKLHDDLDRFTGSYVWSFLAENWDKLKEQGLDSPVLERVIRRRAAIQFGRMEEHPGGIKERELVDPVDYYIYPSIGDSFRLGEIVRHNTSGQIRVVLTPHCFLVVQPGQDLPRASNVLTTIAMHAADFKAGWVSTADSKADDLRKRTSLSAGKVVKPPKGVAIADGRYCFLPGFLEIPDIYCDLMQLETVPFATLMGDYERIAVLDGPYAEALQASLGKLYGSVGVPILNPERMQHLAC